MIIEVFALASSNSFMKFGIPDIEKDLLSQIVAYILGL